MIYALQPEGDHDIVGKINVGNHAWQDQVSYVVLREEWPTHPYPPARGRRVTVLVNGVPGSGKTTLARQLAAELRIPLFSKT